MSRGGHRKTPSRDSASALLGTPEAKPGHVTAGGKRTPCRRDEAQAQPPVLESHGEARRAASPLAWRQRTPVDEEGGLRLDRPRAHPPFDPWHLVHDQQDARLRVGWQRRVRPDHLEPASRGQLEGDDEVRLPRGSQPQQAGRDEATQRSAVQPRGPAPSRVAIPKPHAGLTACCLDYSRTSAEMSRKERRRRPKARAPTYHGGRHDDCRFLAALR